MAENKYIIDTITYSPLLTLFFGGLGLLVFFYTIFKKNDDKEEEEFIELDVDNDTSLCEKVIELQTEIKNITQKYEGKIINLRIKNYNEKEELIKTIKKLSSNTVDSNIDRDIRTLKRQQKKDNIYIEKLQQDYHILDKQHTELSKDYERLIQFNNHFQTKLMSAESMNSQLNDKITILITEKTDLIEKVNQQEKQIKTLQLHLELAENDIKHSIPKPGDIPILVNAFNDMTIGQIKNVISKEDEHHILPGDKTKYKYILTIIYNHYRLRFDDFETPFHNAKFIKSVHNYLDDNKMAAALEFNKIVPYFDYIYDLNQI